MDVLDYLNQIREKYLASYRRVIHETREKHPTVTPEVWFRPNRDDGSPGPELLCIDVLAKDDGDDKPQVIMVTGEPDRGPLVGTMHVGDVPVKVYQTAWETLAIWAAVNDPDLSRLDPWKQKWLNADRPSPDEDGLGGIVHYFSRTSPEGGGYLHELDLGSAPVDALLELFAALVELGATEIEVGRSDGTDLPANVHAVLARQNLSVDDLATLLHSLLQALPEIREVERIEPDRFRLIAASDGGEQFVNIDNLHRLLLRTHVEARAIEIYRFMRGKRQLYSPQDVLDLSQLSISIKDTRFIEHVLSLGEALEKLLRRHFVADLWQVCVWDSADGMRFALADEAEKYHLTPDEMFDRARRNFLKARPPVDVSSFRSILVARTNDSYDATLLLDDNWWQEIAPRVAGEVLACAPSRNAVLIGGTGDLSNLRDMEIAIKSVEETGDHLITSTVLVRRAGQWEEFIPPATALPVTSPKPVKPRSWWKFW